MERKISDLNPKTAKVGDGATICLYSDMHAYTIIKVTKTTLTIQRDNAIQLTKPEIIPGGFVGHCINNNKIEYQYEKDPEGIIEVVYWSNKYKCYMSNHISPVIAGRHEYYDYNF